MWWRWTIFIVCAILIAACIISTMIDWVKGKTGPFGPAPENWWGCGVFTLIIGLLMWWVAKQIFK